MVKSEEYDEVGILTLMLINWENASTVLSPSVPQFPRLQDGECKNTRTRGVTWLWQPGPGARPPTHRGSAAWPPAPRRAHRPRSPRPTSSSTRRPPSWRRCRCSGSPARAARRPGALQEEEVTRERPQPGPPHLPELSGPRTHLLRPPCRSAHPRTRSLGLSSVVLPVFACLWGGDKVEWGAGLPSLCLMLETTPSLPFRGASLKGRDFTEGAVQGAELAQSSFRVGRRN